jgi:hypothetical protein
MRYYRRFSAAILPFATLPIGLLLTDCGSKTGTSGFDRADGATAIGTPSTGDAGTNTGVGFDPGDSSLGGLGPGQTGPGMQTSGDGGVACPTGLQCDVSCPAGQSTTITGTVYDPAGKNPIYNVAVYVPTAALQDLPQGVPTGSDACSCGALFRSGALASTTTGVDGTFKLTDVPVGGNVPLVIQVGKWRRQFSIPVTACTANAQADKSITLPGTVAGPGDSLPDIAVSTGSSDSLECLMRRIGLPASEYVAGAATGGHVHLFSGGRSNTVVVDAGVGDGGRPGGGNPGGGLGGGGIGMPEPKPMTGSPPSDKNLWSSQDQLMPYDIVLLSCEGGETYDANPPALEAYLNAGGRVFASHYQYAWFAGPLATMAQQSYTAPADWGSNLATWSIDTTLSNGPDDGVINQTLNGSTAPFPKGQALAQWLQVVGALGQNGVPAGDLSIYQPRNNASVSATQLASQPWITSGQHTMYFSFDTPVNPPPADDGGPGGYCGRAVFSDLHVGGDPLTKDRVVSGTGGIGGTTMTEAPPGGCDTGDLSPQEKALEFMLFDLSSCVIPDTVAPPTTPIPR